MRPDPVEEYAPADVRIRAILRRYDEVLLRDVTRRLIKPRNQWPIDELIEKSIQMLNNPVSIDRKLRELPPAALGLMAMLGFSGLTACTMSDLMSLLPLLDDPDGRGPVTALLDQGLIFPDLTDVGSFRLKSFEDWYGSSPAYACGMVLHPAVMTRARVMMPRLPMLRSRPESGDVASSADGLEWPLRLGVLWQVLSEGEVRLTQAGILFRRDLQRIAQHPLLSISPDPAGIDFPDAGLVALELAVGLGLLSRKPEEIYAGTFPASFTGGSEVLAGRLLRAALQIRSWNPLDGYAPSEGPPRTPMFTLAVLLALGTIAEDAMLTDADIGHWLEERRFPPLRGGHTPQDDIDGIRRLLDGMFVPMTIVERLETEGSPPAWRLSASGRYLLLGEGEADRNENHPQSLVVQPNCEILGFRQGLSPDLIQKLSRFAQWKTLGVACTLELTPESVYRGLESGLSPDGIRETLRRHSSMAVPTNVLDSLAGWSRKRERITVFPSTTLIEFQSPEELDAAIERGLIAQKITERIGIPPEGREIDYKHFRLLGNRDYESRPQECVVFEADGLTFSIDPIHSDLLLEAELVRLAEVLPSPAGQRRKFRLTPASLRRSADQGVMLVDLERWFVERSGQPLSPAARLIYCGSGNIPAHSGNRLVVQFPSEMVTEGVLQWPDTARWVESRLGNCVISVKSENLASLERDLATIGVPMLPFGDE